MVTKAPSKKQQEEQVKSDALNLLREYLNGVDTIYTVLLSVSRDGMSRTIMPVIATIDQNGKPQVTNISWLVARAGIANRPRNNKDGVVMGGCGMDMGFALVYEISTTLHGHRNEGGYKLKHQWL